MSFTQQEVKIANSTCRNAGASAFNTDGEIRAIVPKYVSRSIDKDKSILDFGSGKQAVHAQWLRKQGFNVAAWEFGENFVEGVHDKDALSGKYSVVYASNVLNVQSSMSMFLETLMQIYNSLETGGALICNYPASPRKMLLNAIDMAALIQTVFGSWPERVGGTASAPLWKVQKPYGN